MSSDIFVIFILFLLSGFFSSAEASLFSLTDLHLHKMISRRLGGGNEAYYTRVTFRLYVEETDNDANKDSALI